VRPEHLKILQEAADILAQYGQPVAAYAVREISDNPAVHAKAEEEKALREQAYHRALDKASERSRIARERQEKTPVTLRYFMSEEAVAASVPPPKRAYTNDAGYDLSLLSEKPVSVAPGDRVMIPTGVGFEIPDGWWGHIRSRTSMGKRGLIPAAQVVDSDYTGILTICLANVGRDVIRLEPGERVAQIVFIPHWSLPVSRMDQADVKTTDRGRGSFGSSGKY
jgi:dUTP pyrophosphatase